MFWQTAMVSTKHSLQICFRTQICSSFQPTLLVNLSKYFSSSGVFKMLYIVAPATAITAIGVRDKRFSWYYSLGLPMPRICTGSKDFVPTCIAIKIATTLLRNSTQTASLYKVGITIPFSNVEY